MFYWCARLCEIRLWDHWSTFEDVKGLRCYQRLIMRGRVGAAAVSRGILAPCCRQGNGVKTLSATNIDWVHSKQADSADRVRRTRHRICKFVAQGLRRMRKRIAKDDQKVRAVYCVPHQRPWKIERVWLSHVSIGSSRCFTCFAADSQARTEFGRFRDGIVPFKGSCAHTTTAAPWWQSW